MGFIHGLWINPITGTWERQFQVISCRNPKEIPQWLLLAGFPCSLLLWYPPVQLQALPGAIILLLWVKNLQKWGLGSNATTARDHWNKELFLACAGGLSSVWQGNTTKAKLCAPNSLPVESDTDLSYFHVCHILSASNRSFLHLSPLFYPLVPNWGNRREERNNSYIK